MGWVILKAENPKRKGERGNGEKKEKNPLNPNLKRTNHNYLFFWRVQTRAPFMKIE